MAEKWREKWGKCRLSLCASYDCPCWWWQCRLSGTGVPASNDFPMGTIYNLISASLNAHGKENHAQKSGGKCSRVHWAKSGWGRGEHGHLLSHLLQNGAGHHTPLDDNDKWWWRAVAGLSSRKKRNPKPNRNQNRTKVSKKHAFLPWLSINPGKWRFYWARPAAIISCVLFPKKAKNGWKSYRKTRSAQKGFISKQRRRNLPAIH